MKTVYGINWNTDTLISVTVLDEHHMCDGATVETYLCKDAEGKKFTCSKDLYEDTPEKAWLAFRDDLVDGLNGLEAQLEELKAEIETQKQRLIHVDNQFAIPKLEKFIAAHAVAPQGQISMETLKECGLV